MQKPFKNIFILSNLLILTACSAAKMNITSKPIEVQKNESYKSTGISEIQPVTIRTFQKVDNSQKEVAKASCDLKGIGFSAKIFTPGIVNIPVYGKTSSPISVYCTIDDMAGNGSSPISNFDLTQRQNSAQSAGYAGGLIGAVIASAISSNMKARPDDRFAYNPVNVNLSVK